MHVGIAMFATEYAIRPDDLASLAVRAAVDRASGNGTAAARSPPPPRYETSATTPQSD